MRELFAQEPWKAVCHNCRMHHSDRVAAKLGGKYPTVIRGISFGKIRMS